MNEILIPLLVINAAALILIILYGVYLFKWNATLASHMDDICSFIKTSNNMNELGNIHMENAVDQLKYINERLK